MAAWQFGLEAIPRKEWINLLGYLPTKSSFNLEDAEKLPPKKWEKIVENHTDLRQKCWFSNTIAPSEIILEIDKYVKRASWSDEFHVSWKTYSKQVDNDAHVLINEENGKIKGVFFRADLREKEVFFLKNIIKLAVQFDWLLMDNKGNIVEPINSEIKRLVLISDAHKILTEP